MNNDAPALPIGRRLGLWLSDDGQPASRDATNRIRAKFDGAMRLVGIYEQNVCEVGVPQGKDRILSYSRARLEWVLGLLKNQFRPGKDIWAKNIEDGHACHSAQHRDVLLRYADDLAALTGGQPQVSYGQFKQDFYPQDPMVWEWTGQVDARVFDRGAACVTAYDAAVLIECYFKAIAQPDNSPPAPNRTSVTQQRLWVDAMMSRVGKFACGRPRIALSCPFYAISGSTDLSRRVLASSEVRTLVEAAARHNVEVVGWWAHIGGVHGYDAAAAEKAIDFVAAECARYGYVG